MPGGKLLLNNWYITRCQSCAGAELPRLGMPTALLAAGGFLAISGQGGGITCVPRASLERGGQDGAFELRDAGGVGRLITSLFSRWADLLHGILLCACLPASIQQRSLSHKLCPAACPAHFFLDH